jgi:tRNA 5-methylaminomethyl-2-thiouridine biosynthesis bifunctional protein
MPYIPGLYVSSGHGSRGLLSCLLSSELLAKVINNEDCIESQPLIKSLNPTRFLIRDLKRRNYNRLISQP